MVSDLFFSALLLLGLLWLSLMLQDAWPSDRPARTQRPSKPLLPLRKRSSDPKPFLGLTRKPPCATCAQAAQGPAAPPPPAPPPITSRRSRPRQVDTSQQCCPNANFAYRGWVGWGNLHANGLPTICQPQFVNFLPHLHDWLTTNSAGIIAGAMTQHGHKHTQQSVANIA